ncbi:hypothetical protein CGRA01v4_03753 [Colletotrichum graminicola]|nr:hypothetical protein CGRA01v4_03753 [Colletotrichum graminicola]
MTRRKARVKRATDVFCCGGSLRGCDCRPSSIATTPWSNKIPSRACYVAVLLGRQRGWRT